MATAGGTISWASTVVKCQQQAHATWWGSGCCMSGCGLCGQCQHMHTIKENMPWNENLTSSSPMSSSSSTSAAGPMGCAMASWICCIWSVCSLISSSTCKGQHFGNFASQITVPHAFYLASCLIVGIFSLKSRDSTVAAPHHMPPLVSIGLPSPPKDLGFPFEEVRTMDRQHHSRQVMFSGVG